MPKLSKDEWLKVQEGLRLLKSVKGSCSNEIPQPFYKPGGEWLESQGCDKCPLWSKGIIKISNGRTTCLWQLLWEIEFVNLSC